MDNVWSVVGGVIISFGSAGTIVLGIVKFSSDIIAEKLSKKYQHLLDEKLESHKAVLDKKNYISKVRFDAEFAIYQSLPEKVLDMVFNSNSLYPVGDCAPADTEERRQVYKERLEIAIGSYNIANKEIQANAPFMPKEIYEKISVLRDSCLNKMSLLRVYVIMAEENEYFHKRAAIYKLTELIEKQQDSFISDLREYLARLEVVG